MPDHLESLRIADVVTFLTVVRAGSVTSASRKLEVTPSQVSKAITRLEGYVKARLLTRQGRGIALTDRAKAMRADMEEIVRRAEDLPSQRDNKSSVTIAGPSYLAVTFFGPLCGRMTDARIRAFEANPATVRSCAEEALIDMAITLSAERLPPSWVSTRVGPVKLALYASPALAESLGPAPTAELLQTVPFIIPFQYANQQLVAGQDGCPLPIPQRTRGHSAATIGVALEIAATCDQLAYGPELAARHLLASGRIVEVDVPGYVRHADLYLHVNAETVTARLKRQAEAILADVLQPVVPSKQSA